jgi:hypothetical protein
MEHTEIKAIKSNPTSFLEFLRANRYPVYHKSNIFFRDFQYGLWRYLHENQSKVPYADMEKVTNDLITDWEWRGLLKRVNRQSFELNMPEFATVPGEGTAGEPEAPKGKPAPASGPAAKQAPAASAADDPEKAAKLAELQAKMAAAKAKREAGGEAPAAAAAAASTAPAAPKEASPAPQLHVPPGTDPEKAAKIKELQEKMAAAKAKRESGDA